MKYTPKIIGLLQAIGLLLYVTIVAVIMRDGPFWFRYENINLTFGVMAFLLFFVLSALISASLILGYPLILLLDGKKKDAIQTVLWSVGWIVIFFIIALSIIVLI